MTCKLTQEQEILKDTIREFAKNEIAPLAPKIDWEGSVPQELFAKLPGLGLYGITVPSESGGAGADFLSLVIAVEELSKASGSIGAQISLHNAVVNEAFLSSNNEALKAKMLARLASGTLGAFSFDPRSTITCKVDDGNVVINGSSEYVMSAAYAGAFLVLAKLSRGNGERMLLGFSPDEVKPDSGFKVGAPKKLLGMRASGTATISFNSLKLPLESIVFDASKTNESLAKLLARARLAVAAQALGLAEASLESSVKYANDREQFNTKIGKFFAVQDFIASDQVNIETARALVYNVASELEASGSFQLESASAKIAASNCAVVAARHSIRIHGGYGFVRDYPVERYLRDARLTQIYVESNEALKELIAISLLG